MITEGDECVRTEGDDCVHTEGDDCILRVMIAY